MIWQPALIVTLLLSVIVGIFTMPRKRKANRVKPEHYIIDYSAKRERALKQLGDDYLLARPINRLRQTELPGMLKR